MGMNSDAAGIVARIKKQRGVEEDEAIEAGISSGELERDTDGNVRKKGSKRAGGMWNKNEQKLMQEQGLD